jgi:DNA-binding IclR family transcriptional regulator
MTTMHAKGQDKARAQSPMAVLRVLQILQRLAETPAGLSLTELGSVLDAPKTSLVGLLRGLIESGYVARTDKTYSLESESYALASSIASGRSLNRVARGILERLSKQTGETTVLAVMAQNGSEVVYTEIVPSPQPIRFAAVVGERRSIYAVASGRTILAFQPVDKIEEYVTRTTLKPLTSRTITNKSKLRRLLSRIRKQGYTSTFGESTKGAASFAAPVLGEDGVAIASLLIIGPIDRLSGQKLRFPGLVREAAMELSRSMGYNDAILKARRRPKGEDTALNAMRTRKAAQW